MSPVAQLSGSAYSGKRTTPTFCRSFCRFPHTPSCPKALVPVALRANHLVPRSPRLRGERGWERPPSILGMDSPQTGGFCRPSCRFRGRSQPAPTARVIPAGRLPAQPAAGPGGGRRVSVGGAVLDADAEVGRQLADAAHGLVGPAPGRGEPEGPRTGALMAERRTVVVAARFTRAERAA